MVKISDFGLSEDVYTSGYFRQNKEDAVRLPFKWMPPESLKDAIFTSQSDVVKIFLYYNDYFIVSNSLNWKMSALDAFSIRRM